MGQVLIEVRNEVQEPLAQIRGGGKAGPLEHAADQNAEPDFDLIQPRCVNGRIDKANPVRAILQESLAGGHGF